METRKYKIPVIPQEECTVIVNELLEIIRCMQEDHKLLKEEINRLKELKNKPKIKPSTLEKDSSNSKSGKGKKNKNNKNKTNKPKKDLKTRVEIIQAQEVPANAEFKGYVDYNIQDIVLEAEKIIYRRELWKLADGSYMTARLPNGQEGSHYGVTLRAYIKHQYYFQEVTQPLILRHLQELGITISSGELDKLLKDDAEPFHKEKDDILTTGLSISKYINTDDTGARHKGKNGYCTHIGNELFAWFKSTRSKSRLNFLQILSQEHLEYVFTAESFDYMVRSRLAPFVRNKLKKANKIFINLEELTEFLQKEKITSERHITIILEAGLIGSILNRGLFKDTVIVSDDAGQFNVFQHALCWIHAERNIKKIITANNIQAQDLKKVLDEVWGFYRKLKAYKLSPTEEQKSALKKEFAVIFSQKTSCYALNKQLQKITRDQNELLLVLERPELPLHNNGSRCITGSKVSFVSL